MLKMIKKPANSLLVG